MWYWRINGENVELATDYHAIPGSDGWSETAYASDDDAWQGYLETVQ